MKKFRDLLVNKYDEANIVLYGVPYDCNCSVDSGAADGPDVLRKLSWWLPPYSMNGESLSHIKIFDCGNVKVDSFESICEDSDIYNDEKLKVIFGGDHSISIPFQKHFIEKCKKEEKIPVLIHIDAHCDICDTYLGSKNSHACTVRRALENGISDENLFLVGIREFEKDGFDYLIQRKNKVNLFLASDILENGIEYVIDSIKNKIVDEKYCVYVSFDIDSLDASFVPGTGTPETCGLFPQHLRKILRFLGSCKNVCCLDIVEVAPPLDSNNITSWCAIKLLYEFLATFESR